MKKSKRLRLLSILLSLSILFVASPIEVSATAGRAYSMGGEFHNGADIQSAANYFALCGYRSYWNDEVDMAYLNSATRLNSDVVYFSAHGDQDCIYLPDVQLGDQYVGYSSTTAIINDFYPLSNARLYIYDACLTASNLDGSGINLCTETIASGVDTVIGWTVEIGVNDAYKWQKRFQNRLALGHTVQASANYANGFSDYNDNSTIKSWRIYGNSALVIKKSSKSSNDILSESIISTDLTSNNIIVNINDPNPGLAAIKTVDPSFSSNNYKVTVTKTDDNSENYTIDYTLMNGDFVTSSGYSIIVEKGKAIRVQDNTVSSSTLYSSNQNGIKITDDVIRVALNEAKLQIESNNSGNKVTKQRGEAYYDIENGKHYYRVFTVYEADTGGFGALSYLYPLD